MENGAGLYAEVYPPGASAEIVGQRNCNNLLSESLPHCPPHLAILGRSRCVTLHRTVTYPEPPITAQ